MSSLLRYLADKRSLLAQSYEGNCLAVARDIARLLIDDGHQPFIACVHKETVTAGSTFHHPLMPKKYYGAITWTKHYVCCCEGLVYDPMLDEPVAIEHYSREAFGDNFPMETFMPREATGEYNEAIGIVRRD